MDKEIKKLYISKLYSKNNYFVPIDFKPGINLILGEKYDEAIVSGRKTNGVGKSMCIEFLDFCLLTDYSSSRIKKIPESVLPLEEYIVLELKIADANIKIERNRKDELNPLIYKDGRIISFDKFTDARKYMNDLLFVNVNEVSIPSFRGLTSILIRDERSEFSDVLKPHDITKTIPIDLTPHLFLLGVDLAVYDKILQTVKEIEELNTVIKSNKKMLTNNDSKKLSDVQAELNALNDELSKMEIAIDSFKYNIAFDSMQKEIIELENLLEVLRNKQKVIKHEYSKIISMPKPEDIDGYEIEVVYNKFKSDLGSVIIKSLDEVISFKTKVEDFQKMLLNQKSKELQTQLQSLSLQINVLDDEYSKKMQILDQRGVLKNLKTSLKIFEEKKQSSVHIRHIFEEYEKNTKKVKLLRVRKSQEILELDNRIDSQKNVIENFEKTILEIHEKIMGNKESSFTIETIDKATRKIPLDIILRIYDDGSHSVNRTKVFIYDTALLFCKSTDIRHPKLLIHDNIFDVDQDTLVQCINYLNEQEAKSNDFQYILTLNRDKIEHEERDKIIKLDIQSHVIATFTKENKFLKVNYQEQ